MLAHIIKMRYYNSKSLKKKYFRKRGYDDN